MARRRQGLRAQTRTWNHLSRVVRSEAGAARDSTAIRLLKDTLTALEAHIANDAKREGLSTGQYCPCTGTEVKAAREFLAGRN